MSYAVETGTFGLRPRLVQCSGCACRWMQSPEDAAPEEAHDPAEAKPHAGDSFPASTHAHAHLDADADSDADEAEAETGPGGTPFSSALLTEDSEDLPEAETAAAAASVAGEKTAADAMPPDTQSASEDAEPGLGEAQDAAQPAGAGRRKPKGAASAGGKQRVQAGLPRKPSLVAAIFATATTITLASLLIGLRETVMTVLPATTGFYRELGLAPDPLGAGLEIREVSSARERQGSADVLTVSGIVANIAQQTAPMPTLRVSLYDEADEEVQSVTLPNERASLAPGETVRFDAQITEPRAQARRIRVGFISPPPQP